MENSYEVWYAPLQQSNRIWEDRVSKREAVAFGTRLVLVVTTPLGIQYFFSVLASAEVGGPSGKLVQEILDLGDGAFRMGTVEENSYLGLWGFK